MFCLYPGTSHVLQPLDNAPFCVLKKCWYAGLQQYNHETGGKAPSKTDFMSVFWPAFTQAMTVANIQTAFRKTGMYPIDHQAIYWIKIKIAEDDMDDEVDVDMEEEVDVQGGGVGDTDGDGGLGHGHTEKEDDVFNIHGM